MPTYTEEETKAIATAKKAENIDSSNEALVRIVAKKKGVPDTALIILRRDDRGRKLHPTEEGIYYMKFGTTKQEHLLRLDCSGSDHKILNFEQGAPWKKLQEVTLEEEYRNASVAMASLLEKGFIKECDWSTNVKRHEGKKPELTIDTTAPSTEPFAEESPAVGRRGKKRSSTTPVSALQGLDVDSAPGSASVRASSNVFSFDGTLENLRAKRAKLDAKLDEKKRRRSEPIDSPVTALIVPVFGE